MMFICLCKIFGCKLGIKIYNFINLINKHWLLIHILCTLFMYLYSTFDVVLFDGGSSSSTQDFAGKSVSIQELDSRPVNELDSGSIYESGDKNAGFNLWDRSDSRSVRDSSEPRAHQPYHPGLIETSNGFRAELPANSSKDTHNWELSHRISNPSLYPVDPWSYPANLKGVKPKTGSIHSNTPLIKKTVHFKDCDANLNSPSSSMFKQNLEKGFNNVLKLFKRSNIK